MRIALAQMNSTVGDFAGNREKIVEFTRRAKDRRCNLVLFPELALFGYSPADLLERHAVVDHQLKEFARLQKEIPSGISVLVGLVTLNKNKNGRRYHNSAALLRKGKAPQCFHKALLPNYDVFDEVRHFEPGDMKNNIVEIDGHRILITICEEIWGWLPGFDNRLPAQNPMAQYKSRKKFDAIVNISASPFSVQKYALRRELVSTIQKHFRCPFVYTNMVGGQDEIIFDGGSFATSGEGKILAHNVFFEEDLNWYDLDSNEGGMHVQSLPPVTVRGFKSPKNQRDATEMLRSALVLGIRDFFLKQGITRAHFGLSGGIDSAVVAALAVDALGPGQVTCFTLAGPFSAPESFTLAHQLAKNLGIRIQDASIIEVYEKLKSQLDSTFQISEFGVMHENLQSRLRGMILMAYSNATGSMLLTTGNKSEYATGYSTLYGDMCGGLAPLGDLLKEDVYRLAEHYNSERELIPDQIISRPPTAELRANQKDSDSLPPYDILDRAVEKIVVDRESATTKEEKWVQKQVYATEFKRWQSPPILRVSARAFGRGRRFPLVNKSRD